MFKHYQLEYPGMARPEFDIGVVRTFKSALERQVGEAIRIARRAKEVTIMNSKGEFNRAELPRIIVETPQPTTSDTTSIKNDKVDVKSKNIDSRRWGVVSGRDVVKSGTGDTVGWVGNTRVVLEVLDRHQLYKGQGGDGGYGPHTEPRE